MQQREKEIRDIKKPPMPFPMPEDESIFYQHEKIYVKNGHHSYRIRLDENYKFCNGFSIPSPVGQNIFRSSIKIRQNGNNVIGGGVTVGMLDALEVLLFKDKFIKFDIDAKGSYIFLDIYNENSSNYWDFIFILSNINYGINKKYDYELIELAPGLNTGYLNLYKTDFIRKIMFIPSVFTVKFIISLKNQTRYFVKDIVSVYINDFRKIGFYKRFIDVGIPTRGLSYEINNTSASNHFLFIAYEYED